MARPQRKRPYVRRRTRRQRRTQASYRHGLKDAIGKLLPGPFFSRWRVVGSKWSPLRVFWVAILMVWSAEQTLQARFGETREVVRSLFPKWPLGKSYTGWYQAQRKWLTPLRPALSQRLRRQLQTRAGRRWQREGWCAFAADGSRVECPRTAANEKALKCAGKKKTGPQLFVTTLWHMGTGVPWDFRIGPGTASERRHLEEMLADVPPRSLLVADAGFTGYEFYGRILAAKQRFLLRVGSNVHLPKEARTGFAVPSVLSYNGWNTSPLHSNASPRKDRAWPLLNSLPKNSRISAIWPPDGAKSWPDTPSETPAPASTPTWRPWNGSPSPPPAG